VKQKITIADLLFRTDHVIEHELDVTRHQLLRNNIEIFAAEAAFKDDHTLSLSMLDGGGKREVTAANIVLATGTSATRDAHIPFDGSSVFISDEILSLDQIPRTLAVVGAGVIGCEYACIFAALGVRVTIVDKRERLLSFVDAEIIDTLVYQLRQNRVTLRLGEEVSLIQAFTDEHRAQVRLKLKSGKQIITEKALYSIGRTGATASLGLETIGIGPDDRGRLKVNAQYQTDVPHVYAVGDLIGFPSLASTSMEQGRLA